MLCLLSFADYRWVWCLVRRGLGMGICLLALAACGGSSGGGDSADANAATDSAGATNTGSTPRSAGNTGSTQGTGSNPDSEAAPKPAAKPAAKPETPGEPDPAPKPAAKPAPAPVPAPSPAPEAAPVADAGADQTVVAGSGDMVTLGSGGDGASGHRYFWAQTSGTPVSLDNERARNPRFRAPSGAGVLSFRMTVTGSNGEVLRRDEVRVTLVAAVQARAEARPSTVVANGGTVRLSGSARGGSGGYGYRWRQTGGPSVVLSGGDSANAAFSAPSASGRLEFTLTVTDSADSGRSDTASVTVTVTAPPPATVTLAVNVSGRAHALAVVPMDSRVTKVREGVYRVVEGTAVTLTVTPDHAGDTVAFESGACSANPCRITLNADQTIVAKVNPEIVDLAVNVTGRDHALSVTPVDPTDEVTKVDEGQYQAVVGTAVIIRITPDHSGDTLSYSTSNLCNSNPCTVTLDRDKTIYMKVDPEIVHIGLDITGRGHTVAITPTDSVTRAGSSNSYWVVFGTTVTIDIAPDHSEDSVRFTSGPCNSNPCTLTIDHRNSQWVRAEVEEKKAKHRLTVNVEHTPQVSETDFTVYVDSSRSGRSFVYRCSKERETPRGSLSCSPFTFQSDRDGAIHLYHEKKTDLKLIAKGDPKPRYYHYSDKTIAHSSDPFDRVYRDESSVNYVQVHQQVQTETPQTTTNGNTTESSVYEADESTEFDVFVFVHVNDLDIQFSGQPCPFNPCEITLSSDQSLDIKISKAGRYTEKGFYDLAMADAIPEVREAVRKLALIIHPGTTGRKEDERHQDNMRFVSCQAIPLTCDEKEPETWTFRDIPLDYGGYHSSTSRTRFFLKQNSRQENRKIVIGFPAAPMMTYASGLLAPDIAKMCAGNPHYESADYYDDLISSGNYLSDAIFVLAGGNYGRQSQGLPGAEKQLGFFLSRGFQLLREEGNFDYDECSKKIIGAVPDNPKELC